MFLAKIRVFLKKNRNISLRRFFGPVFTPKASEEKVGKDTFQFLTKKRRRGGDIKSRRNLVKFDFD